MLFKNMTNKKLRVGTKSVSPGESVELDSNSNYVKAFVALKWLISVPEPVVAEEESYAPVLVSVESIEELDAPGIVEDPVAPAVKKRRGRKRSYEATDSDAETASDSGETDAP